MRIHITGNAGSGKTHLAVRLSEKLLLPLYGLDQIVWQVGWGKTPKEEVQEKISAICLEPDWIIEGVSPLAREHADLIVFLDISPYWCLVRSFKRNLPYWFRSRPGLPPKCPEILIIPYLFKIIWQFNREVKPSILSASSEHGAVLVRISSIKALNQFVDDYDKNDIARKCTFNTKAMDAR